MQQFTKPVAGYFDGQNACWPPWPAAGALLIPPVANTAVEVTA